MKFSITLEQRDSYAKQGYVALCELLTLQELTFLNDFSSKLPAKGKAALPRDLWRQDEKLRKIILNGKFANLAYEFIQRKPIKIAFDELLLQRRPAHLTLQEGSCVSSLQGALILCLAANDKTPFDLIPGAGMFLNPTTAPDLLESFSQQSGKFLLIAYGNAHSQYLHVEKDPYCHFLKSLGYVFGEKLHESLHPVLLR